jgi:hypothetical protein
LKPPFLDNPAKWTQSSRLSQNPSEYANAFECHHDTDSSARKGNNLLIAMSATTVVASVLLLIYIIATKGL